MKSPLVLSAVLLLCTSLGATPTVIADPYGGPDPAGADNGDVIGPLSRFDIDMLTFTVESSLDARMDILFNYNEGDAALNTFNMGGGSPDLNVGDVLFTIGGAPVYGVPLRDRDSLVAGHLYQLTSALTSYDVLQWLTPEATNYRPGEFVWIDPAAAVDVGTGSVLSSVFDRSEILAKVNFVPSAGFISDLRSGMTIQFASATCGNDMATGDLRLGAVPEPATFGLVGCALVGLGLIRLRHKRKQ
ncbi:MAG: PEP-CTERM sorting domain-containing protein [Bryobacterales bacterium]|nr:PEP-CTERM sorting domain-containing protein [Bryobacterales bacterium]